MVLLGKLFCTSLGENLWLVKLSGASLQSPLRSCLVLLHTSLHIPPLAPYSTKLATPQHTVNHRRLWCTLQRCFDSHCEMCIYWRMDVPHTCLISLPWFSCYCSSHARDLPANSCSSSTSQFFQYLVALWVVLARHFHGSGVTVAAGNDTYEPGLTIPNMYGR